MTDVSIPWKSSSDDFDEIWENDSTFQEEAVPDILETMFAQQRAHMQAYAKINEDAQLPPHLYGALDNRATQASIREFASYTVEELYEAINHLKNKPWKQTDKPTDSEAFLEELADAWHFWIELHILAGIDPLTVFQQYFKKTLVNRHRQATGY